MNTLQIENLKEGMYFTSKVFLDKTFLLLEPSLPLTKDLLKELEAWSFKQVITDGVISNAPADSSTEEVAEETVEEQNDLSDSNFLETLLQNPEKLADKTEEERLEISRNVYKEYTDWILKVYTHFSTHTTFNKDEISTKMKNLCIFMKDNSKYFLRITNENYQFTKIYLIYHSMRTIVISLVIGLQLHMPLSKLVELGITAMLHEIGMIRIPPQLYLTDRILNKKERKQIATHPLLSCQILQTADFSLAIQNGVLEHHERENGSGYPRSLTGERISLFGKIVAIACTYDGLISKRSFREAKSTHEAVIELLRNESHQFDATIIKALIYCLSLYPIGTYVFMSNGKIGVVTDINPADFKYPIVEIVNETDENGKPLVIKTNDSDLKINRVLTSKEVEDVMNTINNQKNTVSA